MLKKFFNNLPWAWEVLRSDAYVLAGENKSVVNIKLHDPNTFESVAMLAAQTSALIEFHRELGKLIKHHEKELTLLKRRKVNERRK